jgi:hypothetical protein
MSETPLDRHCESCVFFRRTGEMGLGVCHRYPPQGPSVDSFPVVSGDSFCGEYKRS